MSSFKSDETPTHDTYARGLMDQRDRYHQLLSLLQTERDGHYRPLYAAQVSEIAARAHQMTLDLRDQLRPRQDEIEELWSERHLATVQIPEANQRAAASSTRPSAMVMPEQSITWQREPIHGLESLAAWRSLRLPRETEQTGRGARATIEEGQRAYMPVALMTGARDALEEALTELGWLPDGRVTDFGDEEGGL